jgi:diguanylate cyclase (GGDEF)-like protein
MFRVDRGLETMVGCGGTFEALRLAALERYNVLDSGPEEAFDRITRLAKSALHAPIALVSLVDKNRQWFKSRQGLDVSETPRELSFCTYAIQGEDPLIVPDTLGDARFCEHPLVIGEPKIRSYVGVPLLTHDGHRLGTLCVIDQEPRQFSEDQVNILIDLAHLVIDELELRRLATRDSLTGAMTRRFFTIETDREFERLKRYGNPLSCVAIDIDHFKIVNDTYGHAGGDLVLKELATFCRQQLRTVDLFGRLGGEEFSIALPDTTISQATLVAEKLRKGLERLDIRHNGAQIKITASFGISTCAASDQDFKSALKRADAALYTAKDTGRNRSVSLGSNDLNVKEPPLRIAEGALIRSPAEIRKQSFVELNASAA